MITISLFLFLFFSLSLSLSLSYHLLGRINWATLFGTCRLQTYTHFIYDYIHNISLSLTLHSAVINLDLPASQRWVDVVTPAAAEIQDLLNSVLDFIPAKILNPFLQTCDQSAPEKYLNRFPGDYGEEIASIADATGIDVCELIIYNIAYEVYIPDMSLNHSLSM